MATLTLRNGTKVTVPDETVPDYTAQGLREGVVRPDRSKEPTMKWTVKQLEDYATDRGIDLGEAKSKADKLALLTS